MLKIDTKNKLSKSFLFKVLNESQQGIHIVDNSGITLFYNKTAEIIDGMTRQEMIGKNMQDLVDSGTFSESVALDVIKTGVTKEIIQYIKDKVVIATGIPIFNNKKLEAVVVFSKDSKALQEINLRMKKLLIEKNALVESLSKNNAQYLKEGLIISNSKAMKRVMKTIERIALLDTPILLLGEPGVGKTMLAEYIHDISIRRDEPFIKADCSAIPPSFIEQELFGSINTNNQYELQENSLIAKANKGTLFLDEIADMPLQCQGRLVHTLNKFRFDGIDENNKLDIRIISASNENLKKSILDGKFRDDLYYKLNIIPLNIPPLRERNEDIITLINLLLNKYNNFYNEEKNISPKGQKHLINYSWPGNVSELENIIERLVVTSEENIISEENISDLIGISCEDLKAGKDFKEKVENFEKKLILEYSTQVSSMKELALVAKINESTLRKKIARYNLNITFS